MGLISVDDYGRIDFNVNLGTSGWYNGDFNYDGKVNVDDYGIIDFNVGIQGAQLPNADSVPATSVAIVFSEVPVLAGSDDAWSMLDSSDGADMIVM